MTSDIPLLWLCGPPGVGKTAVAWEIYSGFVGAGLRAAYVDVDQLGICYPGRSDDPDRHRLKARNVAALRTNFAAAGAGCLIVSGVVNAERGPEMDLLPGPALVCRLRADSGELASRLRTVPPRSAAPEAVSREAHVLDTTTFADWCVDTSGLSISTVAQQVLDKVGGGLIDDSGSGNAEPSTRRVDELPGGQVLWLSGATGVGKSTIGFRCYLKVLNAGVPAAFVDVGQLSFFRRSPDHALRARNLASVWANHHRSGAEVLVVVGPVDTADAVKVYVHALPKVTMTCCRLHTSPSELTRRVVSRGEGGSWAQPGDRLKGRPPQELDEIAADAVSEAAMLDASQIGLRVEVDGLSVDEAAAAVLDRTAWPSPQAGNIPRVGP